MVNFFSVFGSLMLPGEVFDALFTLFFPSQESLLAYSGISVRTNTT